MLQLEKITFSIFRIILYLFLSVLITGLFSMVSAELGCFHHARSCLVFVTVFFLAKVFHMGMPHPPAICIRDKIFLLSLVILCFCIYFPPSEYILGGWDPGVYLSSAISIVKQGSINFFDHLLGSLNTSERAVFVSTHGLSEFYPGLRVLDPPHGSLIGPQFLHFYPTLLALIYSFFGLHGALVVNAFIGIISLLAMYGLCRALSGPKFGLLGALFLALNPVQIWMARFQNSEMLAQCLFILGFLFLFTNTPGRPLPHSPEKKGLYFTHVISALCFWLALLTRYDFFAIFALLISLGLISLAWIGPRAPEFRPRLAWLLLLLLGFLHALIHQRYLAYLYTPLWHLIKPGVFILIACCSLLGFILKIFKNHLALFFERINKTFRIFCAFIVCALVLYAVFIQSHNQALGWDRFNFLNLASFVTRPLMGFALLGVISIILKSKRFPEVALTIVGLAFTTVTVYRKFIDPFYLWAARRFIPVIIPFIFVCAVKGVHQVNIYLQSLFLNFPSSPQEFAETVKGHETAIQSKSLWITPVLIIALASLYVLTTQPTRAELSGYRDFAGISTFFAEMRSRLPSADLFVTQERRVAEVLHFYYDLPAVYVRNTTPKKILLLQRVLTDRLRHGQKIFILTQNKALFDGWQDITLELCDTFCWRGKILNQSNQGFPKGTKPRGFDLVLLKAVLAERSRT